jgi:hypothetical protein
MAVTFDFLLVFGAVAALRPFLADAAGPRWRAAGSAALLVALAAGFWFVHQPPYWGRRDDPKVVARTGAAEGIYRTLHDDNKKGAAGVYVTMRGTINRDVLDYLAARDGDESLNFAHEGIWVTLDDIRRQFDAADYVVAAEPGNDEVEASFPSTKLLGESLALVRSNPAFELLRAFPAPGGTQYFVFRRAGGFGGLREADGLWVEEGPYPQWGLPVVRWGLGPRTRLTVEAPRQGRYRLTAKAQSQLPRQQMVVRVDGVEVGRFDFTETGRFYDLQFPLDLGPGRHEIELAYSDWSKNPVRPEAVLYQGLRVVPDGTGAPDAAAGPAAGPSTRPATTPTTNP